MPYNSLYSIYWRNFTCARFLNQTKTNDVKIFILFVHNCTTNACTTWPLISVLIRDGYWACFVLPEVVQTILYFGNTIAILMLIMLAKNVLLLFVRKIPEVRGVRSSGKSCTRFQISSILSKIARFLGIF